VMRPDGFGPGVAPLQAASLGDDGGSGSCGDRIRDRIS
jgi:hypothetical protein